MPDADATVDVPTAAKPKVDADVIAPSIDVPPASDSVDDEISAPSIDATVSTPSASPALPGELARRQLM